ncbi:MAG: D-glycero-beta-D-manno-heptose-1,7-bisphosphate 7-phosphatase [Planctomycetes bacterium ADurb.Bin401]|nr:MAG: D-glycero-beta-D-manno-heptose-1,7-bisphosphate 7-phosphatase [Planctomycetes bacterium ADurb.Bin401]
MPDKAIFLDRDDTIIEDSGYISSPDKVKLLPTAAPALVELRRMGYKLIIVSNQSGIARGLFTEQNLAQVHERLKLLLAEQNAYLDRIYYCPYHPDGAVQKYRKDSDWRKPKPGMLLAASKEMKVDLDNSWMIGNDYRDIAAGKAAGCKTILVKSYTKPVTKKNSDPDPDFEAINLREAVNILKRETSPRPVIKLVKEEKIIESPKAAEEITPAQEPEPAVKQPPVQQPLPVEQKQIIEEEKKIEAEPAPEKNLAPPPQPAEEKKTIEEEKTIEAQTAPPAKMNIEPSQPDKQIPADSQTRIEYLLEEIKLLLQTKNRMEQYSEFSAMKLFAGILQALVLFCLLVGIWYKLSPTSSDSAVFTALGFAIVLQLMSLTLLIMHKDR